LNREKAVAVLKEILNVSGGIFPFMALMLPNTDNVLSNGYQIHIKTRFYMFDQACIQDIVIKNNLAITEENGVLVIYKPVT
jgi:hypothetical protein